MAIAEAGAAANPWLTGAGIVANLLGGSNTKISGAGANTHTNFDTSGTVIGKGNAQGGGISSSMSKAADLPWYVWLVGGLVGVAIMKKAA